MTSGPSLRLNLAFLILTVLTISACGGTDHSAVRHDLTRYLRHVNDWAPIEAETAATIDRILRTQFVDEAEVRRQIAGDAPRVAKHLRALRAVLPETREVRDIHARYVETWTALAAGYDSVLRGLTTAD